jgi:hypothetical protein
MKITNILIIVLLVGFVCCRKDTRSDYQSTGVITGPDPRMCVCCGGWLIVIDSITYNFNSVPVTSNIDLEKETFPLFVKLDWQLAGPNSCPKWITIQRMIKE